MTDICWLKEKNKINENKQIRNILIETWMVQSNRPYSVIAASRQFSCDLMFFHLYVPTRGCICALAVLNVTYFDGYLLHEVFFLTLTDPCTEMSFHVIHVCLQFTTYWNASNITRESSSNGFPQIKQSHIQHRRQLSIA